MDISRRTFIAAAAAGAALTLVVQDALPQQQQQRRDPAPPPHPEIAGEDGSKLWLRYAPVNESPFKQDTQRLLAEGGSPTLAIIRKEFTDGITGMLGQTPAVLDRNDGSSGIVIIGTPTSSADIRALGMDSELKAIGEEGYLIRRISPAAGKSAIVIAANTEIGALYGTFHFLRLIATAHPSASDLNIAESPAMPIRMTNHWDNFNGNIERGYAGRSLWFSDEWEQPDWKPSQRVSEYARALASIGMNGVCINNVNANADLLRVENLSKIALIADVLRPYGVRVYLAANFAAPYSIGGIATADPNEPAVQQWWAGKADEIYKLIPDFGGMLVKANSEGQPGPKDYHRSHAEGANCLAAAFAPHNGIVIWRAFVYDDSVDADRVKRAYKEFMPLDGTFLPNVVVQIKNGPLDFQPREPFSPLFGALQHTSCMAEIQPSQEYLGQARHLVYLGTMWGEFLQSDTFAKGPGSTVARVLEGKVQPGVARTGIAGVLDTGTDPNWTGHHFCQANWYALGRMSWNPNLSAQEIADEWTRMTFTNDNNAVKTIVAMLMGSHETFVRYTMPLGLHHMIGGNHYAPTPENARAPRPDWTAVYYHQADAQALGFDRTRRGNGCVDQYFKPLSDTFDNLDTCPEQFLLWFHRMPWNYRTKSGRTLWEELIAHYDTGVAGARNLQKTWTDLEGTIDARRHREVADRLAVQVRDSAAWRDRILAYFSNINKLPVPPAG